MFIQSVQPYKYPINITNTNAQAATNPLKGLGISSYNETTEPNLLKQKDYAKLVSVQDYMDGTNHSHYVQKHLQTPDFQELAESKYFNTPSGFKKLTTIVSELEQKKQSAMATVYSPHYHSRTIPDVLQIQADTDVSDCVKNINKFFKSKFSDDLKKYIRDNTTLLTDLHKTSTNLAYLDAENPNVDFLNDFAFALL